MALCSISRAIRRRRPSLSTLTRTRQRSVARQSARPTRPAGSTTSLLNQPAALAVPTGAPLIVGAFLSMLTMTVVAAVLLGKSSTVPFTAWGSEERRGGEEGETRRGG